MTRAALLLLADSRLPAGGHAHSGGLEEAVEAGRVATVADLRSFLRGRLATAGLVAAAFAAAACRHSGDLIGLDAEYDARTPSPALRKASRAQGRALLRAGRAMWPLPPVREAHHAVALGVVAHAAGLGPDDAAAVAAIGSITGPASAAVRLLGLDPYAVQAVLAGLAPTCDSIAEQAARAATPAAELAAAPGAGSPAADRAAPPDPDSPAAGLVAGAAALPDVCSPATAAWSGLPAASAPLLDLGAERHAAWEVRLFAS